MILLHLLSSKLEKTGLGLFKDNKQEKVGGSKSNNFGCLCFDFKNVSLSQESRNLTKNHF